MSRIAEIGPITVPRLERCLDRLAVIMVGEPDGGEQLIPLYRRLEDEIATRRSKASVLAIARERAARQSDAGAKPLSPPAG